MSDTLAALEVLKELDSALVWMQVEEVSEDSEQPWPNFNLFWILNVTLLRTIGHVLKNVDRKKDPVLRKIIDDKYQEWETDRNRHSVFWEFICKERNNILKNYEKGVVYHWDSMNTCWLANYKDGNEEYDTIGCLYAAYEWWERQLKYIENAYQSEISKDSCSS